MGETSIDTEPSSEVAYRCTEHLALRMLQRGISEFEIKLALLYGREDRVKATSPTVVRFFFGRLESQIAAKEGVSPELLKKPSKGLCVVLDRQNCTVLTAYRKSECKSGKLINTPKRLNQFSSHRFRRDLKRLKNSDILGWKRCG